VLVALIMVGPNPAIGVDIRLAQAGAVWDLFVRTRNPAATRLAPPKWCESSRTPSALAVVLRWLLGSGSGPGA
jgi:hypothetical protein